MELGPFEGAVDRHARKLNARFSYNKRFGATTERAMRGSWTRALHPDYTLSFWPEGITEAAAEREELLVHVHLDAKYRVENIEGLFGVEEDDDADDEVDGNYKRQDLLKMHAYRDAIKRSQGAYVLYPGRGNKTVTFSGFHEILPGLGAFGISPNEFGKAQGMGELSRFLDESLSHLCNRATSRERSGYHLSQAYASSAPKARPPSLQLPELDSFGRNIMALPLQSIWLWLHGTSRQLSSLGFVPLGLE
ncbi:nuclease domain-containing protein [Burkholderia cepacia]|uniref:nuclease domain-containing protein n=1 Tax=Burkholderia cepacia TaxID=292 RepID=UPI00298FF872|nr:nuclease domain-containing protein [Burkholderia cepacia]